METIQTENANLKDELSAEIERYRDLYKTQLADILSQREEIDLAMKGQCQAIICMREFTSGVQSCRST